MAIVRVPVPIYLPETLYRLGRRLKHTLSPARRNLWGDRDIEWSFVAAHLPFGPGDALDFGSGACFLSLIAARRGFRVVALDLEAQALPWRNSEVVFVQGDLLKLDLPADHFDVVTNCSTVEHVGLAGRFSVSENAPDGDLMAMAQLKRVMKPGAVMLLTVPVGRDATFHPLCRVYGEDRLPRLLDGNIVEREEFWAKDQANRWVPHDRATALKLEASVGSWDALRNVYALGCFVLRKPG